jgi:biotin carboxyl carrier protein
MKKLRITIEGKAYEVLVELLDQGSTPSAAPAAAAPVASTTSASVSAAPDVASAPKAAAGAGTVVSPLAGKIVSIDVKVGETVEEGKQVATIEAMKMNTYIYAPKTGRVAEIFVNAGDGVEEGAALMQLG